MTALVRYRGIIDREIGRPKIFEDVAKAKGQAIIDKAQEAGRSNLSADQVYQILTAYKIPVADWRMAGSAAEAENAAAEIGYPVVVKADAESIIHKSDMGAVAVNLPDGNTVRQTVQQMEKNLTAEDLRFFIQKYHPEGLELIMGAKAEKGLGHTIMFGLGGVYVEIMKDVVFNLTPLTSAEAKEMLSGIKGRALLDGVRGQKSVDQKRLVETIQRLSQLVCDLPAIREMDLNPLMAFEDAVYVVDARISI
jgi:acetyltransferase